MADQTKGILALLYAAWTAYGFATEDKAKTQQALQTTGATGAVVYMLSIGLGVAAGVYAYRKLAA